MISFSEFLKEEASLNTKYKWTNDVLPLMKAVNNDAGYWVRVTSSSDFSRTAWISKDDDGKHYQLRMGDKGSPAKAKKPKLLRFSQVPTEIYKFFSDPMGDKLMWEIVAKK